VKKSDWVTWTSVILLVLTGINVLLQFLAIPFALLGTVLIAAGFFGVLVITYGINEFEFTSLLDLVLYAVLIGVLGYILSVGLGATITAIPIVYQIFQGFNPLMIGIVVGGVISILIGFVRLKKLKK